MVKELMETCYHDVTRFTSNTFLRARLGEALEKRKIAAQSYERRPRPKPDSAGSEAVLSPFHGASRSRLLRSGQVAGKAGSPGNLLR
jgi:hypothetical protein